MSINSLGYTIRQGFKNIFRNGMFSVASIATMVACIFLFGAFFSVIFNVNSLVRNIEEEVGVTVLFDEGISQERIDEIGNEIKTRTDLGVSSVKYTSAEEAWEEFKQEYFADNPEYAESFADDNPLATSASYTIQTERIEDQNALVDYLETIDGVREVNQSADAVQTLTNFNRLFTYVSIGIIAILLIISVFLISNTINVGISVRKEEIGIMKLIGATDSFVRAPFIIEGMLLGIIGAAIPLIILYFSYNKLVELLLSRFGILESLSSSLLTVNQVFIYLLPVGIILGIGIGLAGSIITVKRHLKV